MQQTVGVVSHRQSQIPARKPNHIRTLLDVPVEAAKVLQDSVVRTAETLSEAAPFPGVAAPFKLTEAALRPALVLGEMLANGANNMLNGVGPSRDYDHLAADDPAFLDAVFDDPSGWERAGNGEAVGRMKSFGRRGFSETHIVFKPKAADGDGRSPVQLALGMLREAWATEEDGERRGYKGTFELCHDFQTGPDAGKIEYYLFPTGKLPVVGGLKVHETQLRGLPLPDGGLRVPIALKGGAEGLAYVDLRPADGGRVSLNARFAGVEPGEVGEMFGPRGFLRNHTLVERGDGNEIPMLGLLTPDDGGILGMIKDRGWSVIPVGSPGGPVFRPTAEASSQARLSEVPLKAAHIAQDGMDALGDVFASHLVTSPMAIPFRIGAAMLAPGIAVAGVFARR